MRPGIQGNAMGAVSLLASRCSDIYLVVGFRTRTKGNCKIRGGRKENEEDVPFSYK